jgi:uncharacterized membrane protein SpoIIM required for sporulation
MTQGHFVGRREKFWNKFERILNGGGGELRAHADWFPQGFRELTQDLNIARAHGFDPSLIERLNRLVLEGNQILYRHYGWSFKGPVNFLLRGFPRAVRARSMSFIAALLVFYGLLFFTALACLRFPDLTRRLIPAEPLMDLEQMYDPENAYFLTPRPVGNDADMFGYYVFNNVTIAFRIFAGGILAGLGSMVMLCLNALMLGAATAHIINLGFTETFFSFTAGHSAFELTGIVLSAQGGFLLGYHFFVTRGLSRGASLRQAGKTALPLITGSALLLFAAAVIEAFWSSRHEIPAPLHYASGILAYVLLGAYFLFAGRRG